MKLEPASSDSSESASADHDLVRRAQQGDRHAMESLVLRHHPEITRLLWRFVRNPADLEDLVQETFLRLVRSLHTWRADQPFRHWITRIATNVGRDFYRRQAVRRRWATEPLAAAEGGEASLPEAVDPGADPAARAAASEFKELLSTLAPDDRALLTLHHLEGWDLKTIAAQFGWTVTATKLRARRARNRLRALLTETHSP